jgi:predicted nuclease with TOPRIM domain
MLSYAEGMTIEKLAELIDRGFRGLESQINSRFEGVEQRLDRVEQRLDSLEQRMDRVEQRMDDFEQRFNVFEVQEKEHFHFIMDSLSGFMKRMTDQEDEFVLLNNDTNLVKGALKHKLEIDVDSPEFR